MNRTDWLSSNDPMPMLHWLRERGGERKLRLFASACCRRLESLPWDYDAPLLRAIERAEMQADGRLTLVGFDLRRPRRASGSLGRALAWRLVKGLAEEPAWNAAREALGTAGLLATRAIMSGASPAEGEARGRSEFAAQAGLLRDIFGHLFHEGPLYLADVVAHEPVLPLARMIYSERSFHDLPILADALEEAGCADEEMLEHCREPGEHARGCWVVDAILGKS
jgi:hypothetical protein